MSLDWQGQELTFKRAESGSKLPWGLRLTSGYWFIPYVEDPEHLKRSEAQTAIDRLPTSAQDGYILKCDGDPKKLQVGAGYSLWPISIGPIQELIVD